MGFRGRAKEDIHKTVSYSLKLKPRKTVRLRETGNDHPEDGLSELGSVQESKKAYLMKEQRKRSGLDTGQNPKRIHKDGLIDSWQP